LRGPDLNDSPLPLELLLWALILWALFQILTKLLTDVWSIGTEPQGRAVWAIAGWVVVIYLSHSALGVMT
jgi:hypothetical protein